MLGKTGDIGTFPRAASLTFVRWISVGEGGPLPRPRIQLVHGTVPQKCARSTLPAWSGILYHEQPVKWEIPVYMNVQEQIKKYIASQPEPKRSNMQELHLLTLQVLPGCKLWFSDGKDSKGHTVSNPNIGYGLHTIKYADRKTKEFFQIGMSANTTGISVYILGLKDKTYLSTTYGKTIGKASVTGYCIKFKTLKDINIDVLEAAIRHGFASSNEKVS